MLSENKKESIYFFQISAVCIGVRVVCACTLLYIPVRRNSLLQVPGPGDILLLTKDRQSVFFLSSLEGIVDSCVLIF